MTFQQGFYQANEDSCGSPPDIIPNIFSGRHG